MAADAQTTPEPLSPEWMVEMFGEPHPQEVVELLFNRDSDGWTMGQVRDEVLRMAERRRREREAKANWSGFPPDSDADAMHWLRDPMGRCVLASWNRGCLEFWANGQQLPGPADMREQGWRHIAPLALPCGVASSDFPFVPDPEEFGAVLKSAPTASYARSAGAHRIREHMDMIAWEIASTPSEERRDAADFARSALIPALLRALADKEERSDAK